MSDDILNNMREKVLELDPVYWCEKYLSIDNKPLKLKGGWEPFIQIYRSLGIHALSKQSKPIIFLASRQIGKSQTALALSMFFLASEQYGKNNKPPIRIMHLFPQLEMAARFSKTKFNPTIDSSLQVPDPKKQKQKTAYLKSKIQNNNALNFKEFIGGNHIFIESVGLDGTRLRGITADVALFDEIQDMRTEAIANVSKSLTAAQYGATGDGIQLFFGTPKSKGSDFEKRWKASNQQYYHLGCEKCFRDFPLFIPDSKDAWEQIWIDDNLPKENDSHGFIVKCPHCEHEQDKRQAASRGKWVAYNPEGKYIGFHINQLYIPTFPRSKIINEKPENHPTNTERAYCNEVLGMFFSGSSKPMSTDIIDEKCGVRDLMVATRLKPSPHRRVILALDWGQKSDTTSGEGVETGGKSYTIALVLIQENNKLFKVAFAEKFPKPDNEFRLARIEYLYNQYHPDMILGDLQGTGSFEMARNLQRIYGKKYLAITGLSRLNDKYSYKEEDYIPTIQFEKDYVLEQVFEKFKRGEIKFPYHPKTFEHISWLVEHCASMDVKITRDRSGEEISRYVKGSVPNDGLMCIVYGYVGSIFLATEGFAKRLEISDKLDLEKPKYPISIGHVSIFR